MKIAVFHNLPPGGAKRTIYEECKYLAKKHELDLYNLSSTDETVWDLRKFVKNVYTYEFEIEKTPKLPLFLNRLYKDYQNFVGLKVLHKKIADDIESRGYDVVLAHADKLTQAPFLLRFLITPSLYFCQEYLRIAYEKELKFTDDVSLPKYCYEMVTRKIRKDIDKKNATSATKILANSLFTKNNIDKAYKISSLICHLGVDTNIFKKYAHSKSKYVVFVGEKNSIGGYKLLKSIINKLKPNGIRVKTLGYIKGRPQITDDKAMARFYSNSLATLCVGYNEPFGLASLESMACETPVIAVDEGGYKETVVDGKTGYLLSRNPREFADKVDFLFNNPDIADKIGKAGRIHVVEQFTWTLHNKKLERTLSNVAKAKL